MAIDYAAKEREFLESLTQDTGRDLAQWMAAIAATGLHDRNAIIDWLRQQGFLFARASWMERIYHNGGRPIYLEAATLAAGSPETPVPPVAMQLRATAKPALVPVANLPAPVPRLPNPAPPSAQRPKAMVTEWLSLDEVLSEAKGYRPLAHLVLKEIERVSLDASFAPRDGYIAILAASQSVAGVMTVGAKELRLALVLGTKAVLPPFSKPKFVKPHADIPGAFTHMVVLTDARQVTANLLAAVADAVNSA